MKIESPYYISSLLAFFGVQQFETYLCWSLDQEEDYIKKALEKCNYPKWAISKVKNQRAKKDITKAKNNKKANQNSISKGMVVPPYIQVISERFQRVYMKHNITTAHKPHSTLRKHLVHPKDKHKPSETAGCMYEISCI